jgi:uncharacterized protein (TIGR00297 family)
MAIHNFITGVICAGIIAALSYKVKFLTLGGAIATFLLAGVIFGLGGIEWSIPILTFFILSSILSKLRKKANEEVEIHFEKSGVRDHEQVIANGGLGGVLVIANAIHNDQFFYIIYLATLSAVCADTWATEIGTWKKRATYNILNFKPVEQGISGGVSLIGTIGALLGSVAIGLSGLIWNGLPVAEYFVLIVLSGMTGSFFDSFLGATIQAQNKCRVCNKITEKKYHCGSEAGHHSGSKWVNNDIVNFLSGTAGGLAVIIFWIMTKI